MVRRDPVKNAILRVTYSLLLATNVDAGVQDPLAHFKSEHAISQQDKIIKWELDINGDGRSEMLLGLKATFEKDKVGREPAAWTLYIANPAPLSDFNKSTGTETSEKVLSKGDLPLIDADLYFVGHIEELGKRGIVAMRSNHARDGRTRHIIYAYTIEGDHLKKHERAQFQDAPKPHALHEKYLAIEKQSVFKPREIKGTR